MKNQNALITTAITGLLSFGIGALSNTAFAGDNEKCFGIAKAGQNGCNSNAHQHSCAGHSKIDFDPNDFTLVPKGRCLKVGGKLEPASENSTSTDKK